MSTESLVEQGRADQLARTPKCARSLYALLGGAGNAAVLWHATAVALVVVWTSLVVFCVVMVGVAASAHAGRTDADVPQPSVDLVVSPNLSCGVGWLRTFLYDANAYNTRTFLYLNEGELEGLRVLPEEMQGWTVIDMPDTDVDLTYALHFSTFSDSMEDITVMATDELTVTQIVDCIKDAQERGYAKVGVASFCVRKDHAFDALTTHTDHWLRRWK